MAKKLGQVMLVGAALLTGYCVRGATGCSSAKAAPEVVTEKCSPGHGATHAYPGLKVADLAAISAVVLLTKPEGGYTAKPTPVLIGDGMVATTCGEVGSAFGDAIGDSVIFSLPQ